MKFKFDENDLNCSSTVPVSVHGHYFRFYLSWLVKVIFEGVASSCKQVNSHPPVPKTCKLIHKPFVKMSGKMKLCELASNLLAAL